jgi:hypothetical protein
MQRTLRELQNNASSAYRRTLGRGKNSKAAARAAAVYTDQADQLIGFDRNRVGDRGNQLRNQAQNYGTDAYRERTSADQDYRNQSLRTGALDAERSRNAPRRTQLIDDMSSFLNKDGRRVRDPELALRATSGLGLGNLDKLSLEELSAVAPVVRQNMQLARNYERLTNELYQGAGSIFGEGGNEAGNVILKDLFGPGSHLGATDYIAELFDQFGFGNAETVVLANGKKVRKDDLLEGVYETGGQRRGRYDYSLNPSR